ncbi:hypothetical protein [Aeromonas veronii]|uniref:hypothetical protein n=1 Tax=Aeromonas veronii TaxID=654 RepID=UPI003D2017B1
MNQNIKVVQDALDLALNHLMISNVTERVEANKNKAFYTEQVKNVLLFTTIQTDEKVIEALCRAATEIVMLINLYNETTDDMIINNQIIRVGAYMKAVVEQYPEIDFTRFKTKGDFQTIFNITL